MADDLKKGGGTMGSAGALTRLDRGLAAVFMTTSLVFLVTIGHTPYPLSWLVKTLPIICLALFALLRLPGRAGRLLGAGLLLSGAGDILLELPRTPVLFQAGMGAFILAHLCYTSHFIRPPAWMPLRGLFMGLLCLGAALLGLFIYPRLAGMALPILAYLSVILAMALSTFLGRDNHWLSMAGAVLFVISDALIAVNMFVSPVPAASFWIMATYYPAQAMLTAGVWMAVSRQIDRPGAGL